MEQRALQPQPTPYEPGPAHPMPGPYSVIMDNMGSRLPTRPGTKMAASHIIKVVFVNQGKVYENDLENVTGCHLGSGRGW